MYHRPSLPYASLLVIFFDFFSPPLSFLFFFSSFLLTFDAVGKQVSTNHFFPSEGICFKLVAFGSNLYSIQRNYTEMKTSKVIISDTISLFVTSACIFASIMLYDSYCLVFI